jgi:hypothetical protein
VGRRVRILTDKGEEVVGVISAECWQRFYFKEADIKNASGAFVTKPLFTVGKGQIAELEQLP